MSTVNIADVADGTRLAGGVTARREADGGVSLVRADGLVFGTVYAAADGSGVLTLAEEVTIPAGTPIRVFGTGHLARRSTRATMAEDFRQFDHTATIRFPSGNVSTVLASRVEVAW
jgi:hypothetical protein